MELLEDFGRDYQRYRHNPKERSFLGLQGLQPVLSSNVSAVGVRNTELLIRFHNGSVYSYRDKADQYDKILQSNSKGKWVWRNLRRKNAPYEKIGVIPLPDDIGVSDEDIFQEIDNRYLADLTRHVDVPIFQSFEFIKGINMQKIVVGNIVAYKPITDILPLAPEQPIALSAEQLNDEQLRAKFTITPKVETRAEGYNLLIDNAKEFHSISTEQERYSVSVYTGHSHKEYNSIFRNYDGDVDKYVTSIYKVGVDNPDNIYELQDGIDLLTNALEKSVVKKDVIVKRNVTKLGFKTLFNLDDDWEKDVELLQGLSAVEKGFTSTTVHTDLSDGFTEGGINYEIYVPEGTKGLYAEMYSQFGGINKYQEWDGKFDIKPQDVSDENEFIIQRNTKFKIVDVVKDGKVYNVKLAIVEQEPLTELNKWEFKIDKTKQRIEDIKNEMSDDFIYEDTLDNFKKKYNKALINFVDQKGGTSTQKEDEIFKNEFIEKYKQEQYDYLENDNDKKYVDELVNLLSKDL